MQPQRIGPSNCLPKTQVCAKSKDDVYELTLRVGAQRDGGYYATVNDDDTIYLLPAAPAEALAALAANGLNG